LYSGVFTPERPGDFTIKQIGKNNRDLNEKEGVDIPNPFYEVIPSITDFINSNRRISLEGDNLNLMDFEQEQIEPISTLPTSSLTPLAATPPINANAIQDMRVNANVMQTGLTPTEQALLSPEEQAIRLRQRGMARA